MRSCYKCGNPYVDPGEPSLEAVCSRCSSYLHSCANCELFDEYANNSHQCRESQAKYVSDRLCMNQCTFFRFRKPPRQEKTTDRSQNKERESRARENLDKLFK